MKPLYKYILIILCLTSTLACSKLTYEDVAGMYVSSSPYSYIKLELFDDSTYNYIAYIEMFYDTSYGSYTLIDKVLLFDETSINKYRKLYSESQVDSIKGIRVNVSSNLDSSISFDRMIFYMNNKSDSVRIDQFGNFNYHENKVDSMKFLSTFYNSFTIPNTSGKNYIKIYIAADTNSFFKNETWKVRRKYISIRKEGLRVSWRYYKQ